ncbi:hypothetical protein BJV77DRAFT_1156469 [Russula vinacea]|nr:hypothetical protein BJV77DRAFT_1156469 [Russula vinacea]
MSSLVSAPPPAAVLPSPVDHSTTFLAIILLCSHSGRTDVQGSGTNSIHIVTAAGEDTPQQVHIIKVTDETVHLQSPAREGSVGPPPPSPPASDGQPDEDEGEQGIGDATPLPPSKSEPMSVNPLHYSPRLTPSSSHNSSLAGPGPSTLSRRFRNDDSPVLTQLTPPAGSRPYIPTVYSNPPLCQPCGLHVGTLSALPHVHQDLAPAQLATLLSLWTTRAIVEACQASEEAPRVLVGNLIGEGHVNYVLMYNMLTGIRIAVSRTQAKMKRPLIDEDYTARHKYSFDIIGNELTPSARYDFKFKDYAPWVFRELREDCFQLDPADYLLSLTAQYILSELGSPGKSGSFFYFSRDYRFIIKTIRHAEHKFLRSILKRYYAHVRENPHTLLSRFYDIHESYDLKGSTVGRVYPEERARENPRAVLKDLNWIDRHKELELGPEKRALLTEQLRRDAELLKELQVMDYSLLVGIHNMQRGNRDNVRRNTLRVFSPPDVHVPPTPHMHGNLHRRRAATAATVEQPHVVRRAVHRNARANLKCVEEGLLPEEDTGDRQHFLFSKDEGGLRATDEQNEPLHTVYYLGVIDILTPYSIVKRIEHLWKGMSADRHKISPVPPAEYADRFLAFMRAIMRGGGGGARFKQSDDANRRHLTLSAANPPPRLISLSFSFKFP